jgi:hypothetical protein
MVKPAFTEYEQTLLEGSLVFLAARQPKSIPAILSSLDSLTGPIVDDALALTLQAWVNFRPELDKLIADLTNLQAKVKV